MNKTGGQASVPMNLFATWDIDRSASNCIPRICSMTVCKLIVLKELDKDVQSVFIAVKMQGSKRVFRSNEIFMSQNGLCNTKLELTFSLQYPHFVKRNENRLQIMLQRRKRYKNRAMLGYKTLAVGRVDMADLIQCPIPEESILDLYTVAKDQDAVSIAAHIIVSNMSSLPIDADMESERSGKHGNSEVEALPEVDNYSEEDDETYSSDQEMGSDNLQDFVDDESSRQKRKNRRKVRMSSSSRQQNFIKTKVVSLLKKFKQAAEDDLDPTLGQDPDSHPPVPVDDFDFLYDELEDFNLSDSCPEIDDNISIVSTPKPKLRPFFDRLSHSSSQTEISSLKENIEPQKTPESESLKRSPDAWENQSSAFFSERDVAGLQPDKSTVTSSTQSSPETRHVHYQSSNVSQRSRSSSMRNTPNLQPFIDNKLVTPPIHSSSEHALVGDSEDSLPENIFLVDGTDKYAFSIATAFKLPAVGLNPPIITNSRNELQYFFINFLSKLQKYLNRNSLSPASIKIAVIGSDGYMNSVLRQFVDCLSSRSPDWQSYLVFLIIPSGCNRLSKYLSTVDSTYNSLFGDSSWKECVERLSDSACVMSEQNPDVVALSLRLREYSDAPHTLQLTIAEAMLTFRQTSDDDDSSHKFLPFVSDVKVGENEMANAADSDKEETPVGTTTVAGGSLAGPTSTGPFTSPPSSPSIPLTSAVTGKDASGGSTVNQSVEIKLGLQVDYWKERDTGKYTLKTNFKSFHVTRLPLYGDRQPLPGLTLDIVTKGKKNIMRLPGKKGKEKEAESKSQAVGNVNRLICASKHQHNLLQVTIDGVEWKDVKFFQLSSHWSSHVKVLPIAVFTPV